MRKLKYSMKNILAFFSLCLFLQSASANILMIERFNMTEVDVSIDGLDYSDTVNASLFGELPIMIIDSNSEYLKIKLPDGTTVWVMESDVTTSEYNEALRNCSIVQGGDMSLLSQGAVRGVDSTCQK